MHRTILVAVIFLALGTAILLGIGHLYPEPLGANREDFWKTSATALTLLAAVITGWISLSNHSNQIAASREIESLKPLLAIEIPGLVALNSAVIKYYDVLSRLETSNFDHGLAEQAEKAMNDSAGYLWFMPEKYENAWYQFRQKARTIKEHCGLQISKGDFDQQGFWRSPAGCYALATAMADVKENTPRRL